jgi:lysine-N-methylase
VGHARRNEYDVAGLHGTLDPGAGRFVDDCAAGVRLEPMLNVHKARQPQCFDRFHCTGADCEDTCCAGWGILVDQETYEKYQNPPAHRIAARALSDLVEIHPARSSSRDYAIFRMDEGRCPALHQGLCSIQQTLGEPYIPDLCSTYPRVLTMIGGALEKSFNLSCPEAARLVLSDPDAMFFHESMEEQLSYRAGSVTLVAGDPDDRLHQVRARVIDVIRERSLPLWQRIVSLEVALERLGGVDTTQAVTILEDHLRNLRQGSFNDTFGVRKGDPSFQLETTLELAVMRIGSDYAAPRFIECYSDFMLGLAWTPSATMEELTARYCLASETHFLPFVRRHEHLFENYLINYIFRTNFPYRCKLPGQKFAIDSGSESLRNALLRLSLHYAMMRTLLIGMAALYKDRLSIDHAVKLVQSYSKTFLHTGQFETVAIEYLEKNFEGPMNRIAVLVMD